MVDKIDFNNYKAFKGLHSLEVRPITLFVGKNSSGKTSLCKLFKVIDSLISNGDNMISIDTFNQHRTTDLDISIHNTEGQELTLSFFINNGDSYVESVTFSDGQKTVSKNFIKESYVPRVSSLSLSDILKDCGYDATKFNTSSCYIGPVRRSETPIKYQQQEWRSSVGIDGINAYQILIDSHRTNSELVKNVSGWLEDNLEGQKLSLKELADTYGSLYSILINHNDVDIPIYDVGQGVTQVLPIIVQSFISSQEQFVVIEEPELHLHPAAHACIAERLACSAKELGRNYVIESHSENFLLGLRKMVVDPESPLESKDVVIYFIKTDENGSYLDKITINENGELSSWPTGIFSESFDLMTEIMKHQK